MKRLLAALLAVTACLLVPGAAHADGACSGTSGVTVVVQFPDHTRVGCAPGSPSDGYAALRGAGFTVVNVQNSSFVCQIDGYPDSACVRTPPATAYWAYFDVQGGAWHYADVGAAGDTNLRPGSVRGWRFGDGSKPTMPPPTPTPTPTYTPSRLPVIPPSATSTRGSGGSSTSGTSATVSVPTAGSTSTSGPGVPTAPPTTGPTLSGSPTATASATSGSTTAASAGQATTPLSTPTHHSGGLPWIWGAVLVAVLATAGALAAVRRKRV